MASGIQHSIIDNKIAIIVVLVIAKLIAFTGRISTLSPLLGLTATSEMVQYTLWDTTVNLDIPHGVFPPMEDLKKLDALFPKTHKHGFYESKGGDGSGYQLHYRSILPPDGTNMKGVLIWQHGIAAHSGLALKLPSSGRITNYALLASEMTKAGYGLYLLDMAGHGLSEGIRFYIPETWKKNRGDLENFTKFVAAKHSDVKGVFVGGDSYGGNLAIHVSRLFQDNPSEAPKNFRGMCVTAPAIVGDLPPPPVVFLLRNILKPISPTWTPAFMPNPINAEAIWNDEEVRELMMSPEKKKLQMDATGIPFRLGTADGLLEALEAAREKSTPGFNVPFYVAHGINDGGVPIIGTTDYLMAKSVTPEDDRVFAKEENAKHDLMAEPNSEEILQRMVKWMDTRLDKECSIFKQS